MKIYRKERLANGRRCIYLCGLKVFSYRHARQFEKNNKSKFYIKTQGVLDVDPTCTISDGCVLQNDIGGTIKIGRNTILKQNAVLCGGNIIIGNNVIIDQNAVITTVEHNTRQLKVPMNTTAGTKQQDIEIQDDVWIGANATIAPGVNIGAGAVIRPNSWVDSDVPAYAIVAGCPARVIGSRIAHVKNKYKFSIIMPNLNGDKYLEDAIQAFLNQSYKNKELVIIDSSSTDNSHKILKKYADGKVVKWIKEKDKCLSDAINIGIKHCTGDYIGYAGSDDLYINDILKVANALLQEHPSDIFYYDYINYSPKTNKEHKYRVAHELTRANLVKNMNFLALQDIFFSRELLEQFKYDVSYKYAMDYEIYLNILSHRPNVDILHIHVFGTKNINDENISTVYSKGGFDESNRAALKYAQTDDEVALVKHRIMKDKGY